MSEETKALLKGDDKIVQEAKDRFTRCNEYEGDFRKLFVEDVKFANADSDNGWQWPNDIRRNRELDKRPSLTINKTRQHNFQIINDARQNKPSVTIRPVGDGATKESADVYEGVIRHIEYQSNAQVAYDTASKFQVEGGIGYWRVVTDYAGEDSFDQEIYIRRIKDPLSVFIDPDINEKDGSDMRFAFVFDDIPREQAEREYPEMKEAFARAPLNAGDEWLDENHVRIAEYYRVSSKKDELLNIVDEKQGTNQIVRRSELPRELVKILEETPDAIQNRRDIESPEVEWFKIIGSEIVDRRTLPGRYIPIVRVVGDETLIEGELDRKGHTRALKDPQRMYNYDASANVEYGALQTKAPWVAPAAAIEGLETYWETANTKNHSILPYNHRDDDGNELQKPERAQPPAAAESYIKGMEIAAQDMMMVSGQYQADFGQPSNERSGKAIAERQRQGDNATYHFIDNLAIGIRYTGKILLDLIPKIYDTPRIIRILAEDGTDDAVTLDPNAKQAYAEQKAHMQAEVQRIFNPNVGKYEVEADVGPAYATRRQEAWNAFQQIAAQNKELMALVGDIMFQQADFPGAEKIAERMHNMLPPQALGKGAPPMVAQLQGQLQQSQKAAEQLIQRLAEMKLKLEGKDQKGEVERYNAVTDRLEMLLDRIPSQKDIATMVHDLVVQEHQSSLDLAAADQQHHNALELQASAPEPQGAAQ